MAIFDAIFTIRLLVILVSSFFVTTCSARKELEWWQTTVIYQVYPRSFKDSDGDGVGDLKGIEQMADYFKEIGVGAVWLNPIFESPMEDFGYDISNYRKIDPTFGSIDDLVSLAKKLKSMDIKLILDFVPNHSSDKNEWFQKSIKRESPYDNYYIWKKPKGYDNKGNPIPPNNWISVFNLKSAWTFNKQRGEFYLHAFLDKQPDLNYRSEELKQEMKDILTFWMDKGVDGFRIDAVPYLVEDDSFADEAYIDPEGSEIDYFNLVHNMTMDQPETFIVIKEWRDLLDKYTRDHNTTLKVMLTEAYTSFNKTMMYYGNASYPISQMPFNFQLISRVTPQSNATDIADVVTTWLKNMPDGTWANWVIGNHDNFRVATRYGVEMTDALNMLVTLLPGTTVTYYGEELGMEDVFVRWDQTVDPQGIVLGKNKYLTATRDACRSPMQWNSGISAGFSTNELNWLPVNPNYWRINVEAQRNSKVSHLKNYKYLVEARKTETIRYGSFNSYTQGDWILIFTRKLEGHPTFLVVINMGTEEAHPDLSKVNINHLPEKMWVYVSSINSYHQRGDFVSTSKDILHLRPKAALVLTTQKTGKSSASISTVSMLAIGFSLLLKFVMN
ncbi:maltase A3 [Nilaparvata lugens]|uniref:alpha-glucosidase n=1 Tax=Nilaparvata lugens TaxID=108931 RepID=A0A191UR57_NILLU|nr:maltase A3 [Nilaparvata lugens]ANJ04656.1 maltase 2-like protein [Nilaparvata lugens]QOI16745.1 maltase A3 protein [Nilaparvata lugens]